MVSSAWPIAGNVAECTNKRVNKAPKNRMKDMKIALCCTLDCYKFSTAHTLSLPVFILPEYTYLSPHTLIHLVFTAWPQAQHTHFLWNKSFSRPIFQEWKFWNLVNVFLLFAGRRHRGGCRCDTHTHTCIQSFVRKVPKIKENWIYLQNYSKSKATSGSLHGV
jgi:hypothetical protein